MQDSQPALPVARYAFVYQATDDLHLPAYPGALWHSAFGARLRNLSCRMPNTECEACLLRFRCDYSLLFTGPRPPDAVTAQSEVPALMRNIQTIPVPHIFQLDSGRGTLIRAGDMHRISMVLVGTANNHLALIAQAMADAGYGGLGSDRTPMQLVDVVQTRTDGSLHQVVGRHWVGDLPPPDHPHTPKAPGAVRVRFTSPYNADGKKPNPDRLDIGRLLGQIVRRCSLLQYFYTGRRLDAPFAALKAAGDNARLISAKLHVHAGSRYSARQGSRKPTDGLLGHFDLDLTGLEGIWPYLYLGQWLNVGKNASMGYGQYQLLTLDPPA